MKLLTIFVLLALTAQPEGLVEAAKDAKKKRDKSTTKVITNKDVRQSKGKLISTTAEAVPEAAAAQPMTLARHEEQKRGIADAAIRLKQAETRVRELEAEVASLEQQYYNENDLDRRDGELVRRFEDARARLAAAVAALEVVQQDPHFDIPSPVRVIGAELPPEPEAKDTDAGPATTSTPPPQDQTPDR
jgi:peptidyl-tRNA hydrolase